MQCAGDGFFILPATITDYLSEEIKTPKIPVDTDEFKQAEDRVKERINKLLNIKGKVRPSTFHKKLGKILWDECGMLRNAKGLEKCLKLVEELEEEFWKNLVVPGKDEELNQELEKAIRVADFFEIGKLMILDALNRNESCGAHFREEYQTPNGEAMRNDEEYAYVAAWEYKGIDAKPDLHKEPLKYEFVELKARDYK